MNTRSISITKASGTWVVRSVGAVIAESNEALELFEDGLKPVIYLPRKDVEMAFLEPSDHRTSCSFKGEARYFDLFGRTQTVRNAAWSYEDPSEEVTRIKGYIAFYPEKAAVERL